MREEIRQDKDWVVRLRGLPEAPETFYLLELMASHDFQTALQNYLDLEDLRRKLTSWDGGFDAWDEIIELRRAYYEPLLPEIDRQFRQLDARIRLRLEQREKLDRRLKQLLVAPRPEHLATAEELETALALEDLEARLADREGPGVEGLRRRLAHLRGVLTWNLETRYHDRLTEVHVHLAELNADVEAMQAQYDSFVRTRQAASHSYEGYRAPIRQLRARVSSAQEHLERLMKRQGHLLEAVAIRELRERRERLQAYQHQARFAFADSYDRAAKAQAEAELIPSEASGEPSPPAAAAAAEE